MPTTKAIATGDRSPAIIANRSVYWLCRHWLLVANLLFGLYAGLPWAAPVLMKIGWRNAGTAIYSIYSTQCHQLPQRSFFLFGPQRMYSLSDIQANWQTRDNPVILRRFIGNPALGWKVAWSDRMVSMFTSVFLFGLLYDPLRKRLRPLSIWGFVLLVLPMVVDGTTHALSDLAGIGRGFRDGNAWLVAATGNALSTVFYAGDALGSFNSWMRLITGALFGLGVVWFAYPHLESAFTDAAREIESKLLGAGLTLP